MKYILFSIFTLVIVSCQGNKSTTSSAVANDTGLAEVRIINSGDILSTYNLKDDEEAVKAIKKATGDDVEKTGDVYEYAKEDAWPSGMSNYEQRLANKPTIQSFRAFLFCKFPNKSRGTLNVLKIPKKQNPSMPKGFQLTHDIYFVILSSGFQEK